jgi:hypothetical protein
MEMLIVKFIWVINFSMRKKERKKEEEISKQCLSRVCAAIFDANSNRRRDKRWFGEGK